MRQSARQPGRSAPDTIRDIGAFRSFQSTAPLLEEKAAKPGYAGISSDDRKCMPPELQNSLCEIALKLASIFNKNVRIIEEPLASGGMGYVFTAIIGHDEMVIKVARKNEQFYDSSLRNEARILERASGIIPTPRLIADGTEGAGTRPFFAMEYVQGRPLTDFACRNSSAEILRKCIRLCDNLGRLHGEGIIHGDVKPSNVIVGRDTYLLDFGLAEDRKEGISPKSPPGVVLGTPEFVSLETLKGRRSEKSDQYAMGLVVLETIFGERPFGDFDLLDILTKKIRPIQIHGVGRFPMNLVRAIERATEPNPDDRFPSCRDFAAELHEGLCRL